MAKKTNEKGKGWFKIQLDKADTPDDMKVPCSELAMNDGTADKIIKPDILTCDEAQNGDVFAHYVNKATIIDPKTKKVVYVN